MTDETSSKIDFIKLDNPSSSKIVLRHPPLIMMAHSLDFSFKLLEEKLENLLLIFNGEGISATFFYSGSTIFVFDGVSTEFILYLLEMLFEIFYRVF